MSYVKKSWNLCHSISSGVGIGPENGVKYLSKLSTTLENVQRALQKVGSGLNKCFTWFDPPSLDVNFIESLSTWNGQMQYYWNRNKAWGGTLHETKPWSPFWREYCVKYSYTCKIRSCVERKIICRIEFRGWCPHLCGTSWVGIFRVSP